VPTTGEVEEGRTGCPCGKDWHEDNDCGCSKEPFETNSVEGGNGIPFHDLFLDDELGCGKELSKQDEKYTEDNLGGLRGLGCIRVEEGHQIILDGILDKGTAIANKRNAHYHSEERKPLIQPKTTAKEQDAEYTDE